MTDKKRVNLTVNPKTKAEWDQAVERSTEYSSLSDLIRTSVARELSEPTATHAPDGRHGGQSDAQAEAIDGVAETLSRFESTLTDIDDRLSGVEREVSGPKRAELKNQAIDALPEYGSDDGPDGKSATEIAEEIGADRERVRNVLGQLERETGIVEVVASPEGQQFYARRGEY